MGLICFLRGHDWRFGYNKGIPRGNQISLNESLRRLRAGEAHEVFECTRCPAQSRIVDGVRVMLKPHERERP